MQWQINTMRDKKPLSWASCPPDSTSLFPGTLHTSSSPWGTAWKRRVAPGLCKSILVGQCQGFQPFECFEYSYGANVNWIISPSCLQPFTGCPFHSELSSNCFRHTTVWLSIWLDLGTREREEFKKDGEIQDGGWVVGEYGQKIQQLTQIKNVFF